MIQPIDYIRLTSNFTGKRLDDAVQEICKAVVDKQNEIVADYNKRFKLKENIDVTK